jgi:hypothetical protein
MIKIRFLLAVLLEIMMILISIFLFPQNNTIAQTFDTITKQRVAFKNNPQIEVGLEPQ